VTKLPSKAVLEFSFLLFICFLLYFVSSFPFLIDKQLVCKDVFPSSLEILQTVLKALRSEFTVAECAQLKFISVSSESKPNSDSSDEKEMILEQNWDVLVPKYIGMISFVFHFLEQIQRAD